MNHQRVKKQVFTALMVAISVVMGRFFLIPIPWTHGNVNLCDLGIMVAALLIGPLAGGIVGGLSGMILDLISGYAAYAPFSLLAHGLEGLVIGYLHQKTHNRYLALGGGVLMMVVGYFFADSILYTITAGVLGLGTNLLQGLIGTGITLVVIPALHRAIRTS